MSYIKVKLAKGLAAKVELNEEKLSAEALAQALRLNKEHSVLTDEEGNELFRVIVDEEVTTGSLTRFGATFPVSGVINIPMDPETSKEDFYEKYGYALIHLNDLVGNIALAFQVDKTELNRIVKEVEI